MKKILGFGLATLLAASCIGCSSKTTSTYSYPTLETPVKQNEYMEDSTATAYYMDGSEFTPVLRFVVAADTHVKAGYLAQTDKRMANMLSDMYAYSATQEYDKLDALVIVGDYVDYGTPSEYQNFAKAWQTNLKSETAFLCLQAGHELINGNKSDHKIYTGNDMGMHVEINGYHFITISNVRYFFDENGNIIKYEDGSSFVVSAPDPECDTTWIDNELKTAVADTGDKKPIFTFHHHPIENTLTSSTFEGTPIFTPVLEQYSNLVDFSAHTHVPNVHPRAIMQKKYTTLTPGAVFYAGSTSDYVPEGLNASITSNDYNGAAGVEAASGCTLVEVDSEGRIRVLPYNILAREFSKKIGGNTQEQLIRYIPCAGDKSTWLYTEERYENSLPVWKASASVDIQTIDSVIDLATALPCKRLLLTFDQALDDEGIECYKIELYKKGTTDKVPFYRSSTSTATLNASYAVSKYFMTPYPTKVSLQTMGVKADALTAGDYEVKIWAINAFHAMSETPLVGEFTVS